MLKSHLRKPVLQALLRSTRYGFSSVTVPQTTHPLPNSPSFQNSTHFKSGHFTIFKQVGTHDIYSKHRIQTTQIRHIASDSSSDDEDFIYNKDAKEAPKLFVVQPRVRPEKLLQAKLLEALKLADSLEEQREDGNPNEVTEDKPIPYLVVQNPASKKFHADTYFGPGTVDTVKSHLAAIDSQDGVDAVFVNAILSGIQQRNLERVWGKPVLDRVGLIIQIFNAHARTKEAKLQAKLAALMYKKSRLVRVRGPDGRLTFGMGGEAEVVSGRGRSGGGRGFISGAGETELQLQRRRILEKRISLLQQIEEVRRTRALQRAGRQKRGGAHGRGLPIVAAVGYTNAGKSSLVSALSQSDLYIDDKLFATLDPRLRSVILPSGQKVLLSDTVGFISDLPVQLVEAFHATLEEVTEADLLMHVIDISAINAEEQRASVLEVLEQIGVPAEKLKNMIEVWNKVDLLQTNNENNTCAKSFEVAKQQQQRKGFALESSSENLLQDRCAKNELNDESKIIDVINLEDTWTNTSSISKEDVTANWSTEGIACVKVSATKGIGLQELLHLLDEKLRPAATLENEYFVKWRPPPI